MNTHRIELRRQELNISKEEICKAVGICLKSYYLYIGGKPIPSDKLVSFADLLECTTDYLLGIKNYTHITVTDNTGAVLADISRDKIIEHDSVKVILS